MAYGDQSIYNKYLHSSKHSDCGCGGSCDSCSDSKCSCCPPGLVGVYNTDGTHLGCMTPADADEYNANNRSCQEGYIALYKEGDTPQFLGCVSESEFAALYAIVNPAT